MEGYYTPEKNPRIDLDLVYVIEQDGEARVTAAVLPLEVFVDGVAVPMDGVAAVNTHPAYRPARLRWRANAGRAASDARAGSSSLDALALRPRFLPPLWLGALRGEHRVHSEAHGPSDQLRTEISAGLPTR